MQHPFEGVMQAAHQPAEAMPTRRELLGRMLGAVAALFGALVRHRVGDRPERCEPRAVKRRPQPLRYLTKPRAEARAELLR